MISLGSHIISFLYFSSIFFSSNLSYFRCSSYALQITCFINGDYWFKRCEKSPEAHILVPAPLIPNFEDLVITLSVHARMRGVSQRPSVFEAYCDLKHINKIYGISSFTKTKILQNI